MKMGTRSLIYGVHQVFFHPLTVWCAWVALYGKFPKWHESVAIFFHDWGYFGCDGMDTEKGRQHPVRGAELAQSIVLWLRWHWLCFRHPVHRNHDKFCEAFELAAETYRLSLGHSRFYAKRAGIPVSKLFAADKASIYFDPKWAYLLRAHLSGEIHEYVANSKLAVGTTASQWHDWYYRKVGELL